MPTKNEKTRFRRMRILASSTAWMLIKVAATISAAIVAVDIHVIAIVIVSRHVVERHVVVVVIVAIIWKTTPNNQSDLI